MLRWTHGQGVGFHEGLQPGGRLVGGNVRLMPGEAFGCAAHFFSNETKLDEVGLAVVCVCVCVLASGVPAAVVSVLLLLLLVCCNCPYTFLNKHTRLVHNPQVYVMHMFRGVWRKRLGGGQAWIKAGGSSKGTTGVGF